MIASAYGKQTTLAELRRRFTLSAKGLDLRALMNIADTLELSARPVRLELSEIRDLRMPAILHWNLNHFVVIERVRRDRLRIHDPARGERWVDPGEADRAFTGVAVEFTPTPAFTTNARPESVGLGDLFGRVRGLVPSLAQMFLLATLMQLFALALPILNQLIVDEAINKGDLDLLGVIAIGMLMLVLTTAAVKALQGVVGLYMGTQMSFQMRSNLLRHTLRLPVAWFEKRHVGDILSRFSSLQSTQDFLLNAVPSTILNLIVAVATLGMMAVYSPLLATLVFGSVSVSLLVRWIFFPFVRRVTREGLYLDAKVQTVFLETIRGARAFKLFGHERERVALWQNEQARLVNNQVTLASIGLWGAGAASILAGVQQVLVWYFGARLVIAGDMSLGMLFAFQAYTSQFTGAAGGLITQLFAFRTIRVHLERLADIVHSDEEPGLDIPSAIEKLRGEVELRNVSFRYADHEPLVLREVNLHVPAGEFVCLEGPSGHGKTTLLKLMLGFEEPLSGEVLLDGMPLRKAGIASFRRQIGVVLQDDQLFAGTLADNISFFDVDAEQALIEAAAKAAGIHDEIAPLPMGYMTFTGDLGSTLSAGQRQRVLLARALYREPRILFLDEGTANLDADTEEAVMRTLRSLAATRIVVAHRPRASAGAMRRFHVADGTVRETIGLPDPETDGGAVLSD